MSTLIERINKLSEEIENFPLGNCSPSDDFDKQTAFLYGFNDISKRFILSLKRLDDFRINQMLESIDMEIEHITEAYNLKAELQGIIDYLNDTKSLRDKSVLSAKEVNELMEVIIGNLASESANNLALICSNYGLKDGTTEEAFQSKRNYVYKRVAHLDNEEILELGKKLLGKYSNSKLDEIVVNLMDSDKLGVISEFDNIKKTITCEIKKASFVIWVAVAWFTDRDLANLLYLKSNQGLNIQIIMNDDEINSSLKNKLQEHFEVILAPSSKQYDKLMHNKFCVIDFEKIIHGSYNWTNKAQYNNETISIIESRKEAKHFAKQFLKLKVEIKENN